MGADMILSTAIIPMDKKPDWQAANDAIDKLTPTTEVENDYYLEDVGNDEELADLKKQLWEDLDWFRRFFDTGVGGRELTTLIVADQCVVLSGGLSSGDNPTEACSAIDRLNYCSILPAAGFER